jgi:pimeloyl-ACP methyl ester carboxylesterase
MLRHGSGPPLILLHGVTTSAQVWEEVVPLLAPTHDTIALTALGHRGGGEGGPGTTVTDLIDDAERAMDELGFETAHLAGFSLGGWVALELARRGRARSVTAFAPAGTAPGPEDLARTARTLRGVRRDARRARRVLPALLRVRAVRRYALRQNAERGDRLRAQQILERTDDLLACTVLDPLLDSTEELAPLDPLPCPVTIAWGEADRVLPLAANGMRARQVVPGARFEVLERVGHVPMFDDPVRVAHLIRSTAR